MTFDTLQDFNRIREAIRLNVNNGDELTKLGLELASLGATVGEALADSQLAYDTELVNTLNPERDFGEPGSPPKKPSVAEAERIASANTGAEKDRLRHRSDWIIELGNMVKLRVRFLVGEKETAQ
jgi:hypothetical protein